MINSDMPDPIPPRSVKKNQHYVPRCWLARFAGRDGRVAAIQDGVLMPQVSVDDIMSGDWIYTVFDEWWRPSDRVEDALSGVERAAGVLFEALHASRDPPTDQQWVDLCTFLALTACRYPEVMRRGHLRSKEMAWQLADVDAQPDRDSFLASIKSRFGVELPPGIYEPLVNKGLSALLQEAGEIESLSPQDQRLPEQISLQAVNLVANAIVVQNLFLLDAPPGKSFVLSDRPLPTRDLSDGFSVALSRTLAFLALPSDGENLVVRRLTATPEMVDLANREQAQRARSIIIGSDPEILKALQPLASA
jgi:hypothetical protein